MKCYNCGEDLPADAKFCGKCGAMQQSEPQQNGYYNPNPNNGNNNKVLLIILVVLASLILLFGVMFISFEITGKNLTATPSPIPSATPTVVPTATPNVTPQIIYVPESPDRNPPPHNEPQPPVQYVEPPHESGYKTYYSSKYGFSCIYPSSFSVYDDHGTLTLYTVVSPDGNGIEKIVAKANEGETVSSELRAFKSTHGGTVTYENSGNTYFAVNILNGSTEYYKYCKFKNGNLYWFEFIYPHSQHDIYDIYINDVYQSLYNSLS